MTRINDKVTFYRLYESGALGNYIAQWWLPEWRKMRSEHCVPPKDLWAVRVKQVASPWMKYEMSEDEATDYAEWLVREQHIPAELLQMSECMPDYAAGTPGVPNWLLLQGHIERSQRYFDLEANTDFYADYTKNRMRESMKRARWYHGVVAYEMVRSTFDAASWDTLQELFDIYPDDIIEFAAYAKGVGMLGHNVMIWEVRAY